MAPSNQNREIGEKAGGKGKESLNSDKEYQGKKRKQTLHSLEG